MEICFLLALLIGGALLVSLPFLLTRGCLSAVAHLFRDPRRPEAARAVRRTAWACVAVTLAVGLGFSGYCYEQSVNYVRGAWLDFGEELWMLACYLPLGALLEVVVAVSVPVRVSLAPAANAKSDLGFQHW